MNIDVKELETNEELQLAILNMNKELTKILNYYLKQDSNNTIDTDKLTVQELSIDTINYDTSIIDYINKEAKIYETIHGDYSNIEECINNEYYLVKYNIEINNYLITSIHPFGASILPIWIPVSVS